MSAARGDGTPGIGEWLERARVLRAQGRFDESLAAANRALEAAPQHAGAWFSVGAVLDEQGDLAGARNAYRKALELDPGHAHAWSNYGAVLGVQGDRRGEIAAYRRALAADPRLAPVWSNLGNALRESRSFDEAVEACRRATEIDPAMAIAWSNLGSALHDAGRYDESAAACRSALQRAPRLAEAWNNLGSALRSVSRYDEAIEAHERAVRIRDSAAFRFNFGITLQHAGRTDDAIAELRRALETDPGNAEVHIELSLALLGSSRLAEGWQEYEWRWQLPGAQAMRHTGTAWDGGRTKPRHLLLWSEQGIGDQIFYAGMIPELASSPMRVTAEVDPRLVTLFRRSFPAVAIVPRHEPSLIPPDGYDCQAPLADLGRWLRPSLEAFIRHDGYLKADAGRAAEFRSRLGALGGGLRVGLSWSSANQEFGDRKSTALAAWAPLLRVPGVSFIDLQYGDTARERAEVEALQGIRIAHLDDVDLFQDLEGLAALCAACDLVITVSNVTAHMAGALGKPVWLLAPRARGRLWYWFTGRRDSPWYPSMRIYSQHSLGDWQRAFGEIARDLADLTAGRAAPR